MSFWRLVKDLKYIEIIGCLLNSECVRKIIFYERLISIYNIGYSRKENVKKYKGD